MAVGRTVTLVGKSLELEVTAVNSVVVELALDSTECCDLPLGTDSEIVVKTEGGLLTGWVMDGKTVLTTWPVACVGAIEDASLGPVEDPRTSDEMMEC